MLATGGGRGSDCAAQITPNFWLRNPLGGLVSGPSRFDTQSGDCIATNSDVVVGEEQARHTDSGDKVSGEDGPNIHSGSPHCPQVHSNLCGNCRNQAITLRTL